MQKSNDLSLKEALELMLKGYKLEQKATETDLLHAWIKLMGSFVAGNTSKVELVKNRATVYLKSAVMKNEFSMRKQELIEALNTELGENVVNDLDFK